jgi:uncharacterized OsmC-like protein
MNILNGLNMEALVGTVDAIKADPTLADFEFRATNRWVSGGENRSRIQGFYGAGCEDDSRNEAFEFTNGEPPVLLGNNEGANPVEFLLHALAGCVTTTTVLHAAARSIRINEISTELNGRIDVEGLLDLDDGAYPGYESITIRMNIDADCSEQELDELVQFAANHSPVRDTICRPVSVNVERVRD